MMNDEESDAVSASILDDDEEEIFEVNHDKPILPLRQSGNRVTQWTWCGKFLKSVGLSASFLALGLCLAVPGVTLLDLKERVGTTIEYISYIFTARSVGYLLGSILGGFLFDHFDQQLQLSYTLLLTSVATITAPWCTSLVVLAVMISFQGIAMGVLDTGGNVFCMRIWGQQSGPYIQAMHFAFGIGAFIAPLLAKPFLAPIMSTNMTPIITHPHLHMHIPGMGAKQHLLYLRDIEQPLTWNQTTGGIGTTEYFGDGNSSILMVENSSRIQYSLAPTFTSTSPRPKKPNIANGIFLKKSYADGQHIKDYLKNSKDSAENKKVANVIATSSTSLSLTTNILATSANGSAVHVTTTPTYVTVNSTSDTAANNKNTTHTTTTATTTTTTTTTAATTTTTTTTAASTTESKTVVSASIGSTLASMLQLRTVTNYVMKQKTNNPNAAAVPSSNHNSSNSNSSSSSSSNNGGNISISVLTGENSNLLLSNESMSTENPTLTTFHPQKPETFDKMLNNAVKRMSHIQFTYMIIGVFLFLISIFFMCLYCYDKSHQRPVAYRCDPKHKSCFEDKSFRIQILIALFIFFFLYVGMEVTFGGFIMIFAVEQFNWSKDNAVMLTSLFWGALATGRGLSIFITRCCVPCWMLVTNIILVLIASLILSFGLSHYQLLLWVGTLLFGLGLSSLFPTGMSWAESYMTMTGKATAVLIVGSALGEMIIPAITSFFFTKKQKMVLMYVMFGLSLLSCLCFIIMQNLASNQHRKSTRSELSSSLEQQQQVSLMNGSPSNLSLGCNGDLTCRKHVTFKLDHDRVKYDRLHSSDEE